MNSEAKENKHVRREPWPQIKNVVNHGKTAYSCDARIKVRGERKFFDTREKLKVGSGSNA